MLAVRTVSQFRRDLDKARKQGKDTDLLKEAISRLTRGERLPSRFRDHSLRGSYSDCRECHLTPDWLLVYRVTATELQLVRLGSHSELFG